SENNDIIKMKRKINQVGTGTLTVSLPRIWIKNNNLNKGDEIDLEIKDTEILIRKDEITRIQKKAELNLDEFNKVMIDRFIHEFYRQGIGEIILTFTKEKIPDYRYNTQISVEEYIKDRISNFIGLEIISHTKNRIVLENLITKEECQKIDLVRKRIYFLLKEFLDEFCVGMEGDFKSFFEKNEYYHRNITKFIYYYLRLLNFSDIPINKKMRLFGLYTLIIKIKHKIRHTSERILEMKRITPKIIRYVKDIFDLFLDELNHYHQKDLSIKKIEELIKNRYKLFWRINKEKFNEDELRVISDCKFLIDIIDIFIETNISLNIEKYTENI
ncbi:MAG: AbrB/MazE/SpoVT family DNA-binding domain-containing protein, partial [Candidatus Woesearchaeota archaeon]